MLSNKTLTVVALMATGTAAAWTNIHPKPLSFQRTFRCTITSRSVALQMIPENTNLDITDGRGDDDRSLSSPTSHDHGDDKARIQAMQQKLDDFLGHMDPQKLGEKMEVLLEHPEEFAGLMADAESFETKLVDELLSDADALQDHLLESSETSKSLERSEWEDFTKFLEEAPTTGTTPSSASTTTSTMTMPKVNISKEMVEQAFHTIETGMVALAKGLGTVVKESKEAIVHLNTTTIGSTDTTYEQALQKVGTSAKGLFLVLGTVAKDATNFVVEEAKHFKDTSVKKKPERKVPFFLEQDEDYVL